MGNGQSEGFPVFGEKFDKLDYPVSRAVRGLYVFVFVFQPNPDYRA